jgi:uncharacterized coiled-coil protein SlyX
MIIRDRERLIARIRQLRRASAASDESSQPAAEGSSSTRVDLLEARVAHLEQLVEGLQDSVHREIARQGKQITELHAQIQPAAMGAALSRDARDRGLDR